eukprot:COSAG01_NODE_4539_length_4936_cov_3.074013_2_plen_177_part_00
MWTEVVLAWLPRRWRWWPWPQHSTICSCLIRIHDRRLCLHPFGQFKGNRPLGCGRNKHDKAAGMMAHAGTEAATTCHSWEVFLTPHITHCHRPTDVQARQRYRHSNGVIRTARVLRVEKECRHTTFAQRFRPHLHLTIGTNGMLHLRTGVPVPDLIHLDRLFVRDDVPHQVVSLAV